MKEEMVIQTSELEDHIRTLAMQLKDTAGNSCTFVAATVERTSSTTLTPNLTPTRLSMRIVDFHADPSPSTTAANDASTSRVASITTNDTVECIDAADASEYLIHQQHLHTYNYILSVTEGDESANQSFLGEPYYLSRWPKE